MKRIIGKNFSEEKNTFLRQLVNMTKEVFNDIEPIYIGAIGSSLYENKELFNEMVCVYKGGKRNKSSFYLEFTGTELTNASFEEFKGYTFKITYLHVDDFIKMIEDQDPEMLDIYFGALSQVSAFITPKINMIVRSKGMITSKVKEKLLNQTLNAGIIKSIMKERLVQLIENGKIAYPITTKTDINIKDLKIKKIDQEDKILQRRIENLKERV